jgi:hypothetical protein
LHTAAQTVVLPDPARSGEHRVDRLARSAHDLLDVPRAPDHQLGGNRATGGKEASYAVIHHTMNSTNE